MNDISLATMIFRLVVAFVLSGVIGFEREWYRKLPGLRILVLVGLGSALLTLTSFRVRVIFPSALVDPSHIAAQIIIAIGLLGAASIIRSRAEASGITTAATTFIVAGIGMASAFGFYAEAIAATILTLVAFYGLSYAIFFIRQHSPAREEEKKEGEVSNTDTVTK